MSVNYFLSIFQYICNIFWSFIIIVYRIPVTTNVCFGQVLLVALIFLLVLYFILRPASK